MIKVIEQKEKYLLYTVKENDSLEKIAANFGVSKEDILRNNPLFSSMYPGCVLCISGIGKKRIIVRPLQTLDDIAKEENVSKESIIKQNNLASENVFVGMVIYIDKE